MTATLKRAPRGASSNGTAKVIAPKRGLPGGRAVVGGLLVTVAALGSFAAVSGAGRGPTTRYVVVARDVPRGATLSADDLAEVAIELPAPVARQGIASVEGLDGRLTTAPLSAGDLLQRSDLLDADTADPLYQLSFQLEATAAVGGSLRRGDTVDVLATYGSSTSSQTRVTARSAVVLDVPSGSGSGTLGEAREVTLTLGVADPQTVLELSNALSEATVRLVRTTGVVDVDGGPDLSTAIGDLVPGSTGGSPTALSGGSGPEPRR